MSTNKSFSMKPERYSRALLEVSKESKELDKVESDVKNFQSILKSSFDLQNFIKDPTRSVIEQKNTIILLSEKLMLAKNLKNFFLLLIEKRRIFYVNKIFDSFLKLISKKRGELKASLISSKLSKSELEKLSNDLSKSTGATLKLDYKVDKNLIGGLKLQLGSVMINTSIKNKLKKYEQIMLES